MGVCTDVENPVKGVTLKSSASLIGHWTPQFLYVLDTEGIEKLLAISRHTATHTDQTTGEMTKELQTTNNNVESEKLKKQDPLSDYSHLWNICRKENVLRFESLTSEFDALAKRYGLSAEISLLKSGPNAPSAALDGDSKDAKSTVNVFNGAVHMLRHDELKTFNVHDLSVENVALIQRIYVQDFAFFGYSTDLPIVKPVAAVSSSQNVSVSSRGQLDTSSLSDTSSAAHKAVHEPAADSSLGKRSFQESSIPSTASAKSVGSKQMNTASMPTDRPTNTSLANASMSELIAQLQRRKAQTTATPSMQTSRN